MTTAQGYSRFHAIISATPATGLPALPPRPVPAPFSTGSVGGSISGGVTGGAPGGGGTPSESSTSGGGAHAQHPHKRRKVVADSAGSGFAKALKSAAKNESTASRQVCCFSSHRC